MVQWNRQGKASVDLIKSFNVLKLFNNVSNVRTQLSDSSEVTPCSQLCSLQGL